MPFRLEREKTNTTPYVLIDEEKGYIKIEGECFLEDILSFFREINEWLANYLADEKNELTFDCEMAYFNSSTTKQLYNMLLMMDKHSSGERKVIVNWISDKNDEIGIEHGEDFKDGVDNLVFNLVEK